MLVGSADVRPHHVTKTAYLSISIRPSVTTVESVLEIERAASAPAGAPLVLHRGAAAVQTLLSLGIDGSELLASAYVLGETTLSLTLPASTGARFTLRATTRIAHGSAEIKDGLSQYGGVYCTSCEPEGFRNIMLFQDRPDVMPTWTVRVEADAATCPVLLSNGHCTEAGPVPESDGGRNYAIFVDPVPKPSYLFALVAGDLVARRDTFRTRSGRDVALGIYAAACDADRTAFAMSSLKKALRWDEDTFGLEYDLSTFSIVAVSDYPHGAVECKSLNIFNTAEVLVSASTATDADFRRIEFVVGHELFHNWSGNRVTVRSWLELTIKEGLTTYRSQLFTGDLNGALLGRIEDVQRLRAEQFPEDAGPTAHAIRPENSTNLHEDLYTATIYNKGAEVFRLYATLLGREGFRRGADLYFKRHDGRAVTCEGFFAAMHDANVGAAGSGSGGGESLRTDLLALKSWFGQAGTPTLRVTPSYDAGARTLALRCEQVHTPSAPGAAPKVPVLIPIAVGLIDGASGAPIPLHLRGAPPAAPVTTTVLRFSTAAAEYVFEGVPAGAVPSILRNFSAPVRCVVVGQSEADLVALLMHDEDAFNRYDAAQRLGMAAVCSIFHSAFEAGCSAEAPLPLALVEGFRCVLRDGRLNGSFRARLCALPCRAAVSDNIRNGTGVSADPLRLSDALTAATRSLASALEPDLRAVLAESDTAIAAAEVASGGVFSVDVAAVARRELRNHALAHLSALGDAATDADVFARFEAASNMTDAMATLATLARRPKAACPQRAAAFASFAQKWAHEPLLMNKFHSACASTVGGETPDEHDW